MSFIPVGKLQNDTLEDPLFPYRGNQEIAPIPDSNFNPIENFMAGLNSMVGASQEAKRQQAADEYSSMERKVMGNGIAGPALPEDVAFAQDTQDQMMGNASMAGYLKPIASMPRIVGYAGRPVNAGTVDMIKQTLEDMSKRWSNLYRGIDTIEADAPIASQGIDGNMNSVNGVMRLKPRNLFQGGDEEFKNTIRHEAVHGGLDGAYLSNQLGDSVSNYFMNKYNSHPILTNAYEAAPHIVPDELRQWLDQNIGNLDNEIFSPGRARTYMYGNERAGIQPLSERLAVVGSGGELVNTADANLLQRLFRSPNYNTPVPSFFGELMDRLNAGIR